MSDLHLDHEPVADKAFLDGLKPQTDIDLLVLAGDWFSVCRPKETSELFTRLLDCYPKLLVVPGNHDYWKVDVPTAEEAMCNAIPGSDRVHVFTTPRFEVIGGQRFLGGTLWYRQPNPNQVQQFIDFRQVQAPRTWFFEQQKLLEEKLYEGDSVEDVIVVTHHLPNPNSTPLKFRDSHTDHFFMCNMTSAIMKRKPKLWLHGHTHDPCDYVIPNDGSPTRIVCNPRGYPFEYNTRPPYEPKLIEV